MKLSYPTVTQIENNVSININGSIHLKTKSAMKYRFGKTHYEVPVGFEPDGASIPSWGLFIMNVWRTLTGREYVDRYSKEWLAASIIHDYMYVAQTCPRSVADKMFLEILKETTDFDYTAYIMWTAVRIGGVVPWYKRKWGFIK